MNMNKEIKSLTIGEKVRLFYELSREIQNEAVLMARKAHSRPVARFFEDEFCTGTTVGNIASLAAGFEGIVARTEYFEKKVKDQVQ